MGLSRLAAAMVVAGCSAGPPLVVPAPADGQCQPTPSGTSGLELISISPSVVPQHGGDVQLAFDGEMPPAAPIYVNGVAATLDGSTLHVPTTAYLGPLSIRVGDDPDHPIAALACAGQYTQMPDSVSLAETPAQLMVPLHPELAHDCARVGYVEIANNGDAPFVIYPQLTGSPAFTPIFPWDSCPLPMYYDSCQILMCFSSSVTMTHQAHLVVPSTMTTASLDFSATVLPFTPGLDVALWRPYTTLAQEAVRGVTTLPAGQVAVWDESPAVSFEIVAANGAPTQHWMGAMATVSPAAFRTLRGGAAGQGIYAIVGNPTSAALIHFDDAGDRDASFGEVALASDAAALAVGGSRVLVIGAGAVRAVLPSGALDTSWGSAGVVDFSTRGAFAGGSALDAQGRLYVTTTTGVVRVTAAGAIDAGFHYAGAVTALALAQGAPIVAGGGAISKLDDTGAATPVPLAPSPQLARPIVELGVDAAGQLDLVTDDGQLVRYTASGAAGGVIGFDGAKHLACPASGDCAVVGLANGLDKYLIELAP